MSIELFSKSNPVPKKNREGNSLLKNANRSLASKISMNIEDL